MSGLDIRAETLYKSSNIKKVNDIIDELYKTITHRIHDAKNAGQCEYIYDLPTEFEAGSLELSDLQLIIYSRLIEKIEANNLKVALMREGTQNLFRIRWPNALDPAEKARMKKIIMSHLEKPDVTVTNSS